MKSETDRIACIDEAAQLLPWFVNGTLSDTEAHRVSNHLATCAKCRLDVAEQRRVQDLMRASTPAEYSPQAGLRKLLGRLDEPTQVAGAIRPAAIATRAGGRSSGSAVRWLAAAVVVQGVALGTIAGVQLVRQPGADAPATYRTLTSSSHVDKASLRVAFVPTMTLAELQDLLRANRLTAVGGPSDAGIFTLGLEASVEEPDALTAVLNRLRADPRVRFAEALGPEVSTR